jgi:superfamily II DNA or RNA helicase
MGLKTLRLKPRYSSRETDLLEDLWIPLLANSVLYKRGVGYFRSDHLASAAHGLTKFIEHDGKAQLICGIELTQKDIDAINSGYSERDKIVEEKIKNELAKSHSIYHMNSLALLAWMVKNGILDIKIAVKKDNGSGIFHSKFGICYDEEGDKVVFEGSANETAGGLINNRESISLDVSWNSDPWITERISAIEIDFQRLWDNNDPEYHVIGFPEAARRELLRIAPDRRPDVEPIKKGWPPSDSTKANDRPVSTKITLRPYQHDCIAAWTGAGYKGLIEMATGTGKTFTAIGCMSSLLEKTVPEPLCVVVSCPYTHLVSQWEENLEKMRYTAFKAYGNSSEWVRELGNRVLYINGGRTKLLIIITTHDTFSGYEFKSIIQKVTVPLMLIADEVHAVGSEIRREGLLESYKYRIGLSATPRRYFDDEGTNYLFDYFGDTVYEFPLERAIKEGFLVPYEYYPHYVGLTADEVRRYRELTKKIAVQYFRNKENDESEVMKLYLIQRQKIVVNAANKMHEFRKIVDGIKDSIHHCLIYCSDNQIDGVQSILNGYPIINQRVTYRESAEEREQYFDHFKKGIYKAIVAINVLDEGVDIPSTSMAIIMASSGNPKQYVQRRGRVLRQFPGKEKAIIHDIFVIPDPEDSVDKEIESKIIRKELKRHEEMASIALNKEEALATIERIKKTFGLE